MKTCANCIYKNRDWGDNPCRTCFGAVGDYANWTGVEDDYDPVICAECRHAGPCTYIKGVAYLTCDLKNHKPIFNSKPKWCPLHKEENDE